MKEKIARKRIKGPVKHDGQGCYIFDAKGSMILQIRGRGELGKTEEGIDIQISVGEFLQNAINKHLSSASENVEEVEAKDYIDNIIDLCMEFCNEDSFSYNDLRHAIADRIYKMILPN